MQRRVGSPVAVEFELERIAKFIFVGLIAFLVYSCCMLLFTRVLGESQILGAFFGFILGTSVSYIGNRRYVFQTAASGRVAVKFWAVTTVGLGVNLFLAFVLERLGVYPLFTAFLIFLTVPFLNYVAHRLWTFRSAARTYNPRL